MLPELPEGKNSIVDVRCEDEKGRMFIVEMQMYWTEAFRMRALFNALKAFSNQAKRGEKFRELQPVYCLCLLNENMPETKEYVDEYRHVYIIQHDNHKELTIEGMTFVFIELLKFHTSNKAHKKLTDLWLTFLTMMQDNQDSVIPPELSTDRNVNEAVNYIKEMKLTAEERAHYEKFWDNVACERTLLAERYDMGVAKGIEKGIEKGIKQGSLTTNRDNAKKMKDLGVPIEIISQVTDLSPKEIEKL